MGKLVITMLMALIIFTVGSEIGAAVTPTPIAKFSTNVSEGQVPLSVQFNDLSENNKPKWEWEFGDGNTSNIRNPTHTYFSPGIYKVNLTVYQGNTGNTTSATISATINVSKSTPTITWSNPADIIYRTTLSSTELNAEASVPGTFTYDPAAGTLLSVGTHILHADFTPTDTNNYNATSKDVQINVLEKLVTPVEKSIPTITWSNPADIVYGTTLSATQLNAEASVPGTFVYTPAEGALLGVGTQTLHADFTPTDINNYTVASTDVIINVLKLTPSITWSNPADITYGTPLNETQLNASASVPGNFAYNPISGTVLGAGTLTLQTTFTPTDLTNYTTAISSVSLTVNKENSLITWSNPADIIYGTPLSSTQLNAVATDPVTMNPVSGTFVYTPAEGTVLGVGMQTLHVDFTPDHTANYTTVSQDVTINVSQVIPTIIWANPADITYGTPLNETQLNASASVPGSFAYDPISGTVLGAGTQTLQTTFTPIDLTNYTTASSSVSLTVNKDTPLITWNNPADITYGTSLSETQLNANASVSGNFTYTPAAETVLNVGTHSLHADFTPTNTNNYNATSRDVQINVLEKQVIPVENKVIPPQSISEIHSSPESTWINWTWTNPDDSKFNHTEIYLSGIFQANTSAEYFNATDLQPETDYTIGTRTADIYGNANETWVNASAKTKPLQKVEQSVTDNDQPEIQSVVLFPANTTAGSEIDISTNITDNIGVTGVTVGNVQLMSVNGNWQGNITAPSLPGKYSLLIKANDAAGNIVDTSVPYSVVRRQGGVNVAVLPTTSKVVAGEKTNLAIKVKNTQNIDDTFKVQISVNGLPAFYRAGTSWFDWTEKTVNLRAKQEVLIPIEVKVPAGTVTGLKIFKASVNSEKFSVHGSDKGYLVIARPYTIFINKQTGPKEHWFSR